MLDPLTKEDNFKKIESTPSILLFGTLIDNPDITIVIPSYGLNHFLNNSLDSIINQKENDFHVQIIISDDKEYLSTNDNQLLSFLKKKDLSNLAYFHVSGKISQNDNFNRCISLAKTEYVVMNHDDDILAKDYLSNLQKIMPFLKSHPKIGMVASNVSNFKNGYLEKKSSKPAIFKIRKGAISFIGVTMTGIPSCGFLVNRKLFLDTGGFNKDFYSSGDAFPAGIMIQNNIEVYRFADITGYYRISKNTSLKLNICQGFINQDYLFYKSWQKQGHLFRKLYMGFYENYVYSKNILGKISMFSKLNSDITIESLDFRKTYKMYSKFGFHNFWHAVNYRIMRLIDKISTKRFK